MLTTDTDALSNTETHNKTYHYGEGYQQASSTMTTSGLRVTEGSRGRRKGWRKRVS
ncbi:hypothetical protein [Agarivorans litoreus]|uniref:hypothetical protein n=1 Tax=Agarivorans litoreus TaxID=1510455 RepID=UPI001C7D29F3|nr:hypothetical protein [Agarivorans litoreus]